MLYAKRGCPSLGANLPWPSSAGRLSVAGSQQPSWLQDLRCVPSQASWGHYPLLLQVLLICQQAGKRQSRINEGPPQAPVGLERSPALGSFSGWALFADRAQMRSQRSIGNSTSPSSELAFHFVVLGQLNNLFKKFFTLP